ncbi:exo-alpha-sialidase [Asanoa iriomotensis]|uniref:Exo-alpha-sialidase n=1 Tax=Asanoa iriomotensis TaxID=234613 RepID=A0ABQ4CEV6_9ACTN|nr:exo-alpha-sialidase [Asanoa iriomotensis]GIF61306.1 hypothetical protein Air01nite_74010 [Asanoa iriomotensis]
MAWWSTDGDTWRPVTLPAPAGTRSTTVTAVAGAPDGRLVAVGTTARADEHYVVAAWESSDGGRSWRHRAIPDLGGQPQLWALVHDGHRFVALGGADGDVRGAALVLTSTDGRSWQRDDTAAEADARMIRTAVALPNGDLLAVTSTGEEARSDESGGTRECASAWRSSQQTWTREDLGCHGVPTSLTVLADGRIAAVHWTTLFLRSGKP